MYKATCKFGEEMPKGDIIPYGPIEVEPSSTMLSYGQVKTTLTTVQRTRTAYGAHREAFL